MKAKTKPKRRIIGWNFRTIRYRIMTDANGQKWDVPETEDLRKHDPDLGKHTFNCHKR